MAYFLNVDLDLVAKRDLKPLLEALAKSVYVLRDTVARRVHTLTLELARQPSDPTRAIRGFAKLISGLPRSARKLCNECSDRCLDIGIQAEATPHATHFEISADAVTAAAKIGARIVVTVYAPVSGEN